MISNLRKLYGRSVKGKNRRDIKISLTPETMDMITDAVEFGKGGDGSALIELSVRVLLSLVYDSSGQNIEVIARELGATVDSPYLSNNLRLLSKYIDA